MGLVHDEVSDVMRVISPLVLKPRVPKQRRYLFGGVADRLVPAEQVRDLWLHWDRPRIVWYQGAHLTFRMHPEVDRLFQDALRESNLVGARHGDVEAVAAEANAAPMENLEGRP